MTHPGLKVGAVEIIPLTDAAGAWWPLADDFPSVSAEAWEPYRQRYPDAFGGDKWSTRLTAHLIRTPRRTILVDTGLGSDPSEEVGGERGSLLQQLAALGVEPSDIDLVFLTHLHFDHVGWNMTDGRPTFPKARYTVHQADWDAFQAADEKYGLAFVKHSVTPLLGAGVLDRLTQETELAEGLTAIPTPGHTPGHMSVVVQSAGEQALIIADVIHHPAQVTEREWGGLDMDPEQGIKTRKRMLDWAEQAGMTIVAGHLPGTGIGRIVRAAGQPYWQPL